MGVSVFPAGMHVCTYRNITRPSNPLSRSQQAPSPHPLPPLLLLNDLPNPPLQNLQPLNPPPLAPISIHPSHSPTSTHQHRQLPPHEPQAHIPGCEDKSHEYKNPRVGEDPHQDADSDEGDGEHDEADDDGVEVELAEEGSDQREGGEGALLEGGGEVVHFCGGLVGC